MNEQDVIRLWALRQLREVHRVVLLLDGDLLRVDAAQGLRDEVRQAAQHLGAALMHTDRIEADIAQIRHVANKTT